MNTCPIRLSLPNNGLGVNIQTLDAMILSGWNSHPLSEAQFRQFLDHTSRLRPFGGELDPFLVGEVALDSLMAAFRHACFQECTVNLTMLRKLSRPIACRVQARELRKRSNFSSHSSLALIRDKNAETPFEQVEIRFALESAAMYLEQAGLTRDLISAVVLYLIGWNPGEIARLLGSKVETVRKRIARAKLTVVTELRRQFSSQEAT